MNQEGKSSLCTRAAWAVCVGFLGAVLGCSSTQDARERAGEVATRPDPAAGVPQTEKPAITSPAAKPPTTKPPWTKPPGIDRRPLPVAPSRSEEGGLRWAGMAVPTGNRATSTVLLEKGVPASVQAGRPFEYHLRVTNLSDMDLSSVVVEDDMSSTDFQVESTTPARAGGTSGDLRWSFDKLAPGEARLIRIRGQARDGADLTSCANVSFSAAVCTKIPIVQPALRLTATLPGEVLQCDAIEVAYVVTNPGSGVAHNVVLEDRMPDGLTHAGDPRDRISFRVGDLPAGESRTFRATLRATRTGEFVLRPIATGDSLRSEESSRVVVRRPRLAVVQDSPETSYLGRDVCTDLTVRNDGDGVAKDTIAWAKLPQGAEMTSASGDGRMLEGRIHWHLGDLAPGVAKTVNLCYRPAGAGIYRPVFSAEAYCSDTAAVTAETQVVGIAAVLLEVIDSNDPVPVGGEEIYTITATNQGSAPGANLTITATVEEAARFIWGGGATSVQSMEGGIIRFAPLVRLAPGERAIWQVKVRAIDVGDTRFKVTLTEDRLERPVEETEATRMYRN